MNKSNAKKIAHNDSLRNMSDTIYIVKQTRYREKLNYLIVPKSEFKSLYHCSIVCAYNAGKLIDMENDKC